MKLPSKHSVVVLSCHAGIIMPSTGACCGGVAEQTAKIVGGAQASIIPQILPLASCESCFEWGAVHDNGDKPAQHGDDISEE